MSPSKGSSRHDETPPQSPSYFSSHSNQSHLSSSPLSSPSARSGPRSPSPLGITNPLPLRSPSPLAHVHLHDDSEWSPPVSHSFARDMPLLPDRYSFSWPKSHKPVDPDVHSVWLFDNTAFRLVSIDEGRFEKEPHQKSDHKFVNSSINAQKTPPGPRWQAEFVVAYFGEKLEHDPIMMAKSVCLKVGLEEDESLLETIKRRLEPFITPVLPRGTIRVNIDDFETQTLGPASRWGISSSVNRLHFDPPLEHHVATTADMASIPDNFILPCTTVLAEPTGWGVISDIDDTIKVTTTSSPAGILKSTFIDDPTPVRGMPELYAHLHERLSVPAWFYVSASPYNLYSFLRAFREKYYPQGTMILRDASWENLGGLMASLIVHVLSYKVNRMMKIHGWFPKRRFICIGDSTQKDPETYGEVARLYPGWIKAIFIRRVRDVGPDGENNSDERFRRAFEGLEGCEWFVFDEPEEVQRIVDGMINCPAA